MRHGPDVRLVGDWRYLDLRFASGTGQSRMARWFPDRLVVDYTRTMLATLWLAPHAVTIGHVGLGGGSQVKFLHRHLRGCRQSVAEISTEVLALRQTFRVPPDSERLQIDHVDAAAWLPTRKAAFDVLLVDGYDPHGIPPALSSLSFYADCKASLRPGGAAAFNLYDTDHASHLAHLQAVFGASNVVVLEERRQSNRVALAWLPPLSSGVPVALTWRGRWALRHEFARLAAVLVDLRAS